MTPRARTVLAVLVLLLSSALAACNSDKAGPAASSAPGTSAAPSADLATAAVDAFLDQLLRVILETTEAVDTALILLREGDLLRARAAVGLDELERWRTVPGMIGVKLHPHWHDYRTELLNPIMRRLAELKLPALIHLGFGRRGDFRALATSYPQVPLICAHAGFPFYRDLWVHGRALPNLYVDLSSPYIDEALARAAVATLGPERCLYGTDAPYGFPEKDLTSGSSGPGTPKSYDYGEIKGWIERLPIPSAARAAIFADNLRALLTPAAVNL